MKKNRFSMVELLCAIAVILVLMGILIPTVGKIRERGKVTKAKSEMNAIITAIKSYESTYGVLPLIGRDSSGDPDYKEKIGEDDQDKYEILMMFLTKVDCNSAAQYNDGKNNLTSDDGNSRSINFLDVPKGFTDELVETKDAQTGSFRDPWGKRYTILFDTDYDNKIEGVIDVNNDGNVTSADVLHGSVFVYSWGPPKDGQTEPTDEKGHLTDDICSWK